MNVLTRLRTTLAVLLWTSVLHGCADEPRYLEPGAAVEVGIDGSDVTRAAATLSLPIRLETESEAEERAARAEELGIEIPYVHIDDFDVSIEWTIKNLTDSDGVARLRVSGSNEWFFYVPDNFIVEPQDEPEILSLVDGVPRYLAPYEMITGVVREQALHEAAFDIELMTRAAVNPFTAVLQNSSDFEGDVVDFDTGITIPDDDLAGLVRIDVDFEADQHMVLDYAVRVRDHRGILHDDLLAAPPEELAVFAPQEIVPEPDP